MCAVLCIYSKWSILTFLMSNNKTKKNSQKKRRTHFLVLIILLIFGHLLLEFFFSRYWMEAKKMVFCMFVWDSSSKIDEACNFLFFFCFIMRERNDRKFIPMSGYRLPVHCYFYYLKSLLKSLKSFSIICIFGIDQFIANFFFVFDQFSVCVFVEIFLIQ